MQQTIPPEQTIEFEVEDQVTKSQTLQVLPTQLEVSPDFLEDPSPPEEESTNASSTKVPRAKKYLRITDEQRRDFIDAVENKGEKIIHAAKLFDINYSSAKSILNIYKSEGRATKKATRIKADNVSPKILQEAEMIPKAITTASVSTQTNEEDQQDSLLMYKNNSVLGPEKRSNPYDSISYHGISRFTGNINDYSGSQLQNNIPSFQNIIDPNNKAPQEYQPAQHLLPSINYLNLPNITPNLQYPAQYNPSPSNIENNSLLKSGLLYTQNIQNTQSQSPESGAPQFNLLAPYGLNQQGIQPLFSNNPPNLDYAQLQRLNLPSPGSLRDELPLHPQNKEDMKTFASMSYTGSQNNMSQMHPHLNQLNENNKGLYQQGKTEIRYLPPISMVYMQMPPNQYDQQFQQSSTTIQPVFQMIGNYAPQQNTFAIYEKNQNSNNNTMNNSFQQNN